MDLAPKRDITLRFTPQAWEDFVDLLNRNDIRDFAGRKVFFWIVIGDDGIATLLTGVRGDAAPDLEYEKKREEEPHNERLEQRL